MRDRHSLEALLMRRFPGATDEQIASAANAIMALLEHWIEELPAPRETCAAPCRSRAG